MGFVEEKHGRVSIERRGESFKVHADYGYDDEGRMAGGALARAWRDNPHPEFTNGDIDDLVAALTEARDKMRGIEPVAPEVFGGIPGVGQKSACGEDALLSACAALMGSDAAQWEAFVVEKNKKRNGALTIEFRVNGFPLKFSAFCNRVGAHIAGLEATFDARVEKAAGEMLLQRASDLQRRMTTAVDALRRAMDREVYAEFPAAMEDE